MMDFASGHRVEKMDRDPYSAHNPPPGYNPKIPHRYVTGMNPLEYCFLQCHLNAGQMHFLETKENLSSLYQFMSAYPTKTHIDKMVEKSAKTYDDHVINYALGPIETINLYSLWEWLHDCRYYGILPNHFLFNRCIIDYYQDEAERTDTNFFNRIKDTRKMSNVQKIIQAYDSSHLSLVNP